MSKKVLIITLFVVLAGICNGFMDSIQFHYSASIPAKQEWNAQYWNPAISWENKYKVDSEGLLIKPLKEKYFGAKTFFVWTTDAWHLFKMLYNTLLKFAIIFIFMGNIHYKGKKHKKYIMFTFWIASFIVLYIAQAIGFHLTYTFL